VSASLAAFCVFELGGFSTVAGVGSGEPVSVSTESDGGGPVDVADDPVMPGLPAAVSTTVGVPCPPGSGCVFAPPAAPFGKVSVPAGDALDGPSVDCVETGVPVSTVELVVEVVSLVVGVTWPAVAAGAVPFGWASAKAAGAERKSTTVAAETAAPPAHVRVVQLSED